MTFDLPALWAPYWRLATISIEVVSSYCMRSNTRLRVEWAFESFTLDVKAHGSELKALVRRNNNKLYRHRPPCSSDFT